MENTKSHIQTKKQLVPRLRFREFEDHWIKEKIGNRFKFKQGVQCAIEDQSVEKKIGLVRFIRIVDLTKNDEPPRYITNPGDDHLISMNDLFMVRYGNPGVLGFRMEGVIANNLFRILPVTRETDNHFFYYLFTKLKEKLDLLASSSTMPALNFSSLNTLEINYPSLPEQQKIATFLSALDDKIQLLTSKKELLETYKKGVMQQLFSQTLRFKDEDGKDFSDWEEKKLGEVAFFLDGKRKPIKSSDRDKMKGKYPYYGASGIIDFVNDYIFDEELILLGEDGENIVSRNLPLAFRVSGKCWVNNHSHVIKPKEQYDINFLTFNLERINYIPYNTGTAQPKLNQEVCKNITLNLPSLPEQQKIASFLSAIDEKIEAVNQQITQSQTFKRGLLQKMFV